MTERRCRVRVGFIMISTYWLNYRQGTAMRYLGTVTLYTLFLAVKDMSARVSVELYRTEIGQSTDSSSFTPNLRAHICMCTCMVAPFLICGCQMQLPGSFVYWEYYQE